LSESLTKEGLGRLEKGGLALRKHEGRSGVTPKEKEKKKKKKKNKTTGIPLASFEVDAQEERGYRGR